MLEDHAKYMLGVWIDQGEEELVKAMEEALVFPGAGATVLTACVSILLEKQDSNEWDQMSAMIIALFENNLVSKSDISAGMERLAYNAVHSIHDRLDRFGEYFYQFAVRNLYTLEQLCEYTTTILFDQKKRVDLVRACMRRMRHRFGIEFRSWYFCDAQQRSLLEEYLGASAFNELLVEFNAMSE
ncbi:hypothetical protein THAOC_28851 [Thalassiosira oceanica]|uniref:Uncharacterized protein n=1 Tax=Thalassiosira oceanica TaxID=159749 RepID=K0RDV9_THAOC|nr:hypothetical protein THAOC_28851 [Thalassiosira oceanica]|eukprot:EJK51933.1 hypothetical protein THAOC_28851 [Thalassiosira oceanica]